MIDSATGMKPGERYQVENVERAHPFTGFFLDGKYYLGPELLTAVGWLEGQQFIYDNLDATGEPVFPDRIAGTLDGLVLTLVDGTALKLSQIQVEVPVEPDEEADDALDEAPARAPRARTPQWVPYAAMAVLGGCALALLNRRRG